MTSFRRLFYLLAFILLILLASSALGTYLYRGTPSWYHPRIATTEQTRDAANRADQKLLDLFSWAASARAQQARSLHGINTTREPPVGPKTVTFDEDEINSFISSWQTPDTSRLQQRIARYFTGGRIVFEDDSIILAGQSLELHTLASAEFDPRIDTDGNLRLDLAALRAGRLPVPISAVSSQLRRLQSLLQQELTLEQPTANIDPALTANRSALAAGWLHLLLSAMNNHPCDPVLLIPFDISNLRRGMPAKLTAIKVIEGQITLTVEPMPAADRNALVERLKKPYESAAE
ncbi:MAG TPA: hypothetical protein VGG44_05695 [Tepidisphaeraceae bacterium]|jgi:hypothetical protein